MTRKPPKKSPKSSHRRRSSAAPQSTPAASTPRRAFPVNLLLRALSTPPRPPSHHPFLRAFSTPVRRRSEYSPLVRRLCQRGMYEWLPYDNDLYVRKILRCEGCRETGMLTQNIAFKQGHAGEWVRVCHNTECKLVAYPAQPGTPPDLLQEIEAAREGDPSSSTLASPDSHTSGPSTFSSSHNHSQDLTPSIGGEFEDWLAPLFQEIDMELASRPSTTSISRSPEPVAGPSSGAGLNPLRDIHPQCARDEEIARRLQVVIDEEDAMLLQQLESPPPPEPSQVNDQAREPATLSSLTAELAAITGTQSQAQISPAAAPPFAREADIPSLSRCSSRESSPSPRPRKKKKRLLVHPLPPLPVKRKIRGPMPPVPSAKTQAKATAGNRAVPKSDTATRPAKRRSEQPVKPSAKASQARGAAAALQEGDARPSRIIIISSDDEPEHGALPCSPRPSRAPPTRPTEPAEESSVIDITSSDSDSGSAPPATQLRLPRSRIVDRSRAPSRDVQAVARRVHSDAENDRTSPATQPGSRAGVGSRDLQMGTRSLPTIANNPDAQQAQDAVEAGTSNKENEVSDVAHSCLDFTVSTRLSARQAAARRRLGVFASLAQTSSSSSSTNEEEDVELTSIPAGSPRPEAQSRPESANEVVDATEVFGDPFRFELWPAIPELAHNIDPDLEGRRWILTVKIWYKNNMPPSTKMIALDHAKCSIRLSEVFIVARTFQFAGINNFRVWNWFTTDWDARSLYDYLPVSIADNHTLLIRFPTVATLSCWAENISQAYGPCQTVDPRPSPSRNGKGPAYN